METLTFPKTSSNRGMLRVTLLAMELDTEITVNHMSFYCDGRSQSCTLSHYIYELQSEGAGKWSISHIKGQRGIAKVRRIF